MPFFIYFKIKIFIIQTHVEDECKSCDEEGLILDKIDLSSEDDTYSKIQADNMEVIFIYLTKIQKNVNVKILLRVSKYRFQDMMALNLKKNAILLLPKIT